jgi:uncharacterized membrane protein YeiB
VALRSSGCFWSTSAITAPAAAAPRRSYLRRLAALAGIGFIAHGIFGFNVLLGYAVWGLALPIFRHWSTRALVAALILSAMSFNLYMIARTAYGVATRGEEAYMAERMSDVKEMRAFREADDKAQDSTSSSRW